MDGSPAHQAPATPGGRSWTGRPPRAAVVAVLFAAYAWFASATRPFTVPADVTTAVPIVGMVVVWALQRLRPDGPWRRLPGNRPPAGGTALPWIAIVLVLVGTELASYFGGSRPTHPTLSSLGDTVFQWHAAKAAVYFVWLSLGWYFVRR